MKRIVVEAFEDPSRPSGGHAVILLREVGTIPERPSIRLRPVETELGGDRSGLWRGGRLQPIATRATGDGIELVIGPDVVGNPHLVAGTPVIIEIAEADVRGEFLWPSVAPLAVPRRRRVIVPRNAHDTLTIPAPANDTSGASVAAELPPGDAEKPEEAAPPADAGAPDVTGSVAVVDDGPRNAPTAAEPVSAIPAEAQLPVAAETTGEARSAPHRHAIAAEDNEPAPPSGDLSWTPEEAPKGEAGRSALRYGMVAAAALALLIYWQGRASDPDMQLSDKFARPPATAATKAVTPASGSMKPAAAPAAAQREGGMAVATTGPAGDAAKPVATTCGTPEIKTEPLPGGRMRVNMASQCATRQDVRLRYGGAERLVRFDGNGALDVVLDAFAGDGEPLQVEFKDGGRATVPVRTLDLDRVSKVAVIWKSAVDLDLHAFEYAALPGARGHVWSGAAGSFEDAQRAVGAEKRGRGFLSSSSGFGSSGDRIEVYTFLHADDQAAGAVGLALDYATRGETPSGETCGTGALAEVPYELVTRPRTGPVRRETGVIASAVCGAPLSAEVRYRQAALPALKIKK